MFDGLTIPDWVEGVACGEDPELFFSEDNKERARARAICKVCPAKEQCREYGKGETNGMWGGKMARSYASESAVFVGIRLAEKRDERNERIKRVLDLRASGMTVDQVCEELGVTRSTVYLDSKRVAA